MSSTQVLALIPARGGSKSVPRKNLLQVAGRPLIVYSIEQALACASVTRCIVSTDDAEIAAVARQAGAEVPFIRPAELATDTATDLEVFRHALLWLDEHEAYRPELVVHLRPTGPVRQVAVVDQAISRMLSTPEADSLRSVMLAEQTPYKMWRIEEGVLVPVKKLPGVTEAHSLPRQKLPLVYWQNGYVDIVRPRTVLEKASMAGELILPFVVEGPALELDYPDQIPALERALLENVAGSANTRAANSQEGASCLRHPS